MSTFFWRHSLSLFIAFSLVLSPLALLPHEVFAQPDGQNNDGHAGGVTVDSGVTIDIGFDMDSQGNPVGYSSGFSFGAFGSFVIDAVVAGLCPLCNGALLAGNLLANGLNFDRWGSYGGLVTGTPNPLSMGALLGNVAPSSGGGGTGTGTGSNTQSEAAIDKAVNDAVGNFVDRSSSAAEAEQDLANGVDFQLGLNGEVSLVQPDGTVTEGEKNVFVEAGVPDWEGLMQQNMAENEVNGDYQPVSLSASDTSVEAGGSVTLEWNSERGSACYTQGYGWTGIEEAQGSAVVENITRDQVFLIRCVHAIEYSGGSDNAQPIIEYKRGMAYAEVRVRNSTSTASTTPGRPQTVQPQPVRAGDSGGSAQGISISASPSSVAPGGQTTLSWSSEGNSSCRFSGGWPGSNTEGAARSGRDASGVSRIFNILETSTYTLSCVGKDGVTRAVSATVNVR